jgi:peptidoglycan/xylan/chitin deacetylase (PgdA/CDA1 family)
LAVAVLLVWAATASAASPPRKAVQLAAAIIELEQRIATRGHAAAGEADELEARLGELAASIPPEQLDGMPEVVAFLQKGYAILYRVSPQLSAAAAENELHYRRLLGGEERDIVKREIAGCTVVVRGDPSSKEVALTFDDGPCPGGRGNGTSALLDLLKEQKVRATFFLCGDSAAAYPSMVRRIAGEGHIVGNHTKSHARLKGLGSLSDAAAAEEVRAGEAMILKAMGSTEPLIFFRCPYGSGVKSERINRMLAEQGFINVYWTIDTYDWKTHSSASTVSKVVGSKLLNGAIVLFHERVPDTIQAVRSIIEKLRPKGYRFVTLPQLIGIDNESSARVAFREAAGLYLSGDHAAAMQRFVKLAESEPESILADDSIHYAWFIAMELHDAEMASKLRDSLVRRYPRSLYTTVGMRLSSQQLPD